MSPTRKPLPPPTRIAIVGSRTPDARREQIVRSIVGRLLVEDVVVVTGDCPTGVDAYVATVCRELGVPVVVHRADWDTHGKAAGPLRNSEIVEGCDRLIALPAADSRGTFDSINKAKASGKPCEVIK